MRVTVATWNLAHGSPGPSRSTTEQLRFLTALKLDVALLQETPKALDELGREIREARAGTEDPFDLIVEVPPGADARAWEAAGATRVLTSIEPQPQEKEISEVIEAGP
jgi:hypothetical protein